MYVFRLAPGVVMGLKDVENVGSAKIRTRKVHCTRCGTEVGCKYLYAYNDAEEWFEGKFGFSGAKLRMGKMKN